MAAVLSQVMVSVQEATASVPPARLAKCPLLPALLLIRVPSLLKSWLCSNPRFHQLSTALLVNSSQPPPLLKTLSVEMQPKLETLSVEMQPKLETLSKGTEETA